MAKAPQKSDDKTEEETPVDVEPSFDGLVRFEAGTIHEVMEHVKEWVEWRLRQKS